MTIIPIIESAITPKSIKPFSNSFPSPSLLPKMRSMAPSAEKQSITTVIAFIVNSSLQAEAYKARLLSDKLLELHRDKALFCQNVDGIEAVRLQIESRLLEVTG